MRLTAVRGLRLPAVVGAVALAASACSAAGATRALPTPRPADVRASGTVSVFPTPGTPAVSAKTTISFRGVKPGALGPVTVTGSRSGVHPGHLVDHSDGRGVSFVPDTPFSEGEQVWVKSSLSVRDASNGVFGFTVATPAPGYGVNQGRPDGPPPSTAEVATFASRPDLRPPKVSIVKNTGDAAPGDVFLTPNPALGERTAAQSGPMIVDEQGRLVWFDPQTKGVALNLSVQKYHGRPVLAWFQGQVSTAGTGKGDIVLADQSYREITEVHVGNGYDTDLHDFVITPQDTALLLAYNSVVAPPSVLAGGKSRVVLDAIAQEVDIRTGSVLFEWHSLGNVGLDESYLPVPSTTTEPYDYVHPNSLSLDTDGNLLLSARHTSTIYKLDRVTGTLDWRLGGKRSSFTLDDDGKFTWQHDARAHSEGLLSVFDNASRAPGVASRARSRGLLLRIDEPARKATVVQSDDNPQGALSLSQGDLQALPNGNWFAGWGSVGQYTEFAPDGTVVLDANLGASTMSYRAFRFQWKGTPAEPPRAVAHRDGDQVVVAASWNGATEVAHWDVLAGPAAGAMRSVGSFDKTDFETTMRITAGDAQVVQVRAVGAAGGVLGTSELVTVQ